VEGDEASFVLTTHDRHGNATYRASDHVVATVRPAAERGRLVSTPWDRRSSLPSHGPAPRGSYERPRGFHISMKHECPERPTQVRGGGKGKGRHAKFQAVALSCAVRDLGDGNYLVRGLATPPHLLSVRYITPNERLQLATAAPIGPQLGVWVLSWGLVEVAEPC
jgi:hypothetical protein